MRKNRRPFAKNLRTLILDYLHKLTLLRFTQSHRNYIDWIILNGMYFKREVKSCNYSTPEIDIIKKECYKNSIIAALVLNQKYVEGYYITDNMPVPIEHAFNTLDRKPVIIDHTAIKFKIKVIQRFGIIVPHQYLKEYIELSVAKQNVLTPLKYYYIQTKKR